MAIAVNVVCKHFATGLININMPFDKRELNSACVVWYDVGGMG